MQCPAAGSVEICCLAGRYSPLALALQANRYLPRQDLPLWFSPGAKPFDCVTNWHATLTDRDIDTAARQIRFIIIGRTERRDAGTGRPLPQRQSGYPRANNSR